MSSHHITSENQEPALIIANGAACSNELIDQLLEWNPTVIVLDGALSRVLELGFKIDIILGDFDSADVHALAESQYPVELVHTPDQNYTDLEKGIKFLIEKEYEAANIIWATGKRTDHTLSNISILAKYADKIKLKILDDYSIVFPILPIPNKFSKWYNKGTILSLMPVGTANGITTKNLMYPLNDESLTLGFRNGSSNEVLDDGEVTVEYTDGHLLLMESND